MKEKPAVSIIVAVYNAEKYLSRCIDSILDQTFTDWECLLIDDGSPDNSGKMCDEYAHKDSRFKVIHKPNGGVGSARKCGIDNASGEYTIHIDPDDWVEPDMLQGLYSKAIEDNADMVICDFYYETKSGARYAVQKPKSLNTRQILRDLYVFLFGGIWNKLISLNSYKKYNINFFDDLDYWEDTLTLIRILSQQINVSYLPEALYHYDISNESAINNQYTEKRYFQQEHSLIKLLEYTDSNNLDVFIKGRYLSCAYLALKLKIYSKKEYREKYNLLAGIDILGERIQKFHICFVVWCSFHFSYGLSIAMAGIIHKYQLFKRNR